MVHVNKRDAHLKALFMAFGLLKKVQADGVGHIVAIAKNY